MNRKQRRAHFMTWVFLTAALIAIFCVALLARRDAATAPPKLSGPPEQS